MEEYKVRKVSDEKIKVKNIPIEIYISVEGTDHKHILSEKEYTSGVFKIQKGSILVSLGRVGKRTPPTFERELKKYSMTSKSYGYNRKKYSMKYSVKMQNTHFIGGRDIDNIILLSIDGKNIGYLNEMHSLCFEVSQQYYDKWLVRQRDKSIYNLLKEDAV